MTDQTNTSPRPRSGLLYLVPVPIGNLRDITLRAIDVLKEVDFIISEDTRRSLKLLNHLAIKKPQISYYRPREHEKAGLILNRLSRETGALISDSGSPLVSDPGLFLVQKALTHGIEVVPLPGPTALIPALTASGLESGQFLFLGFPPRRQGERLRFLQKLAGLPFTMIFYEAPHRLTSFLKDLFSAFGNRPFALARELSKIHEEVIRSNLADIEEIVDRDTIRGELVVVVGGARIVKEDSEPPLETIDDIYDFFKRELGINKNRIKRIIQRKKG